MTPTTDLDLFSGTLMSPIMQRDFLFQRLLAECEGFGFKVHREICADDKPWGAYICVREESVSAFLKAYWADVIDRLPIKNGHNLAPKILMVAPGNRLSLQYHHRRGEHWRVLAGPVKIIVGADGASLEERVFNAGDIVRIPCGYWHRLAGLAGWGVIAEIWEHTDPANPSDENDIVRVEDDFSRKTG